MFLKVSSKSKKLIQNLSKKSKWRDVASKHGEIPMKARGGAWHGKKGVKKKIKNWHAKQYCIIIIIRSKR